MQRARIIPCLLLQHNELIKTNAFTQPRYLGDPLNTARIFSQYGADEICITDRGAATRGIHLPYLRKIAAELLCPVSYAGGIRSLADIEAIIYAGFERAIIGREAVLKPGFIAEAVAIFGSSTIGVCVDYLEMPNGRTALLHNAQTDVFTFLKQMETAGAGELTLHCVSRDGTRKGYDTNTIYKAARMAGRPLVALGGAKNAAEVEDLAMSGAVSGCAAGSIFVYNGPHDGVILSYPFARGASVKA